MGVPLFHLQSQAMRQEDEARGLSPAQIGPSAVPVSAVGRGLPPGEAPARCWWGWEHGAAVLGECLMHYWKPPWSPAVQTGVWQK